MLHGVFLATREKASSAILSENGGSAELYRVGMNCPEMLNLLLSSPSASSSSATARLSH